MKLLCLPCLVVCCLSLAEAADFKHFPVVAGRTDSGRIAGRGASAPASPPGNRERVRENARALQESKRNQNVPQQVTPNNERNRVNRKRNKSRSRSNPRKSEKEVKTAVAPVRQRTRTRTQVPRLETSTRRQRPTVEIERFPAIGQESKGALVGFPVAQPVLQQSSKETGSTFTANTIPQSIPVRKLNPIVQSEKASKTFSQSLTELFHPTAPSNINQFTEERRQEEFTEAPFRPPKESVARFQNRPSPLRVKTKHHPLPFQEQPSQAQPFPSQPVQPQNVQVRTQPIQRQPNQSQTFQPHPVPVQQVQAQPIQQQPEQFKPINAQTLQLQPFQGQQFNSEVPAPAFQERPSLFSTPIKVPQQEGAGASFSYEAIVG